MNTAARLEQISPETGHMLVASKMFLDGCELPRHVRTASLGPRALRGVAEPMELFAFERTNDAGVVAELRGALDVVDALPLSPALQH